MKVVNINRPINKQGVNMNKKAKKFVAYLAANAASTLEFEQLEQVNEYEVLFTTEVECSNKKVKFIATLGEETICLVAAGFPIIWDKNKLLLAINTFNRMDFEGKCYIFNNNLVYEKYYFCNDQTFNPSVFYELITRAFRGVEILHEFLQDCFSENDKKR